MALQITQKDGIIQVAGELSSENSMVLQKHLNSFLTELDDIILNLEDVTYIAPSGAYTMERLYLDLVKENRFVQIIGRANKKIEAIMRSTKTSYIFSNDRI